MKKHGLISPALAVALATALLTPNAQAHRSWLMPSASFVEASDGSQVPTVTVDGAVSEDLFEFDSFALQLDGLTIVAPDGTAMTAEALATSRRRSGFELKLTQPGTYRVANVSDTVMASYKVGAGVQYDFDKQLGLRGEWERYRFDALGSKTNADMYSVGLNYKF